MTYPANTYRIIEPAPFVGLLTYIEYSRNVPQNYTSLP